jgi:uncharacterized membrane protein (GlpM family)
MGGELLLRFIVGGSLIVLVTLLAKTRYPMLAGIAMLFPAVTLVGYYFVGQSMNVAQLQQVTKFSIYALSTTFIFLVVFYYAQEKYSLNAALGSATAAWFAASGVLIGVTQQ